MNSLKTLWLRISRLFAPDPRPRLADLAERERQRLALQAEVERMAYEYGLADADRPGLRLVVAHWSRRFERGVMSWQMALLECRAWIKRRVLADAQGGES